MAAPDSDEEPPVTTRPPSSTSSTESPGPAKSPPSPLLDALGRPGVGGSDAVSPLVSSPKPPLPRRKLSSQVSGSGATTMKVANTTSAMSQPSSSKFPASGASGTAPWPPLPQRLSGMDMSGLREVLESTTIQTSQPAAESEHPPSTSSSSSEVPKEVPVFSSAISQVCFSV